MTMLAVRTQVKEILKEQGFRNISNDFMDKLDKKVEEIVVQAAERAKENGRRTVMGKDV